MPGVKHLSVTMVGSVEEHTHPKEKKFDNLGIPTDLEGPWVTNDHAYEVAKLLNEFGREKDFGEKLFEILSAYDDYLYFTEKRKNYNPGSTLALIAPFLLA